MPPYEVQQCLYSLYISINTPQPSMHLCLFISISFVCESILSAMIYTVCINRLAFIDRTAHAVPAFIEHMGVYHGRVHILMTQEILNRADVIPCFQQVGGE